MIYQLYTQLNFVLLDTIVGKVDIASLWWPNLDSHPWLGSIEWVDINMLRWLKDVLLSREMWKDRYLKHEKWLISQICIPNSRLSVSLAFLVLSTLSALHKPACSWKYLAIQILVGLLA